MSFLYPALLGGLAAISVPIAIHLLNKFRVQKTDWGAMRFLVASLRKNERRVKIEDLILLILRCLLFAILVFAFARPVLKGFIAGGSSSGPVSAIVILDSSASMSQNNGVSSRFEEGRKAILEWLDQRDAGSLVGFFLVSDRTEPLIPTPQPDLALVHKMLELARPGTHGTDLANGIRQAYEALRSSTGSQREIRIYTDDQTSAWSRLDDIKQLLRENPDILLRPIVLGKQGENNIGIVALKAEGSVPAAKQPYRLRVEVGNYGTQPAEGLKVSLSVDGEPALSETALPTISPGGTQNLSLVVSFATPGPHFVTVAIPSDAFAADNQRSLAVDVIRRMSVLLVEGGPAESTMDRDAFFLANALLPFSREQALQSYLELKFANLDPLNASELSGSETVFLLDPSAISQEKAQALRDYVNAGGNLVVFPGSHADQAQWNQNTTWIDLLPATLAPAQDAPDSTKLLSWQASDFEHPITSIWNDPAQGSLGSVKTSRFYPLTIKPPTGPTKANIIVRMANGDPAVVEWSQGKGHVVLFNGPATPEWNNLPLHPAFVPFVQRLMGYLNRQNESQLILAPGEPFVKEVSAEWIGKDFSVQPPGADSTPQSSGQVTADGDRAFLRYSQTEALGPYRVLINGESVAAFSVQLDPLESDLRQLDQAKLEALSLPPAPGETEAVTRQLVVTREFWVNLMWAALILLILESTFAHRFSQSK